MTSREVKEIVSALGAELCGVASLDRFSDAPEGYHPLDVCPFCLGSWNGGREVAR